MPTKEQIIEALADTKRPCVHVTPQENKMLTPTDSKFGGDYYLPDGSEAPDMEFLAQVNFAQLPHLEDFPEQGLLQFFLCTEDERFEGFVEDDSAWGPDAGFFQVRWYLEVPSDGPAHPDTVPEARWPMEKVEGGMGFEAAEEIATLAFGSEEDLVLDLGFEAMIEPIKTLFLEAGQDGKDYDLSDCGGVDDLTWDFGNWGFKLGGHPALRYDDIRLEHRAYQDYTVLLFQFDLTILPRSESEADTFCFFIKPEDLKARRFDDILLTWHNCY